MSLSIAWDSVFACPKGQGGDGPMLSISQAVTDDQVDAIRSLVLEFFDYAQTLDSTAASASTFAGLMEELAALPGGTYGAPSGCFLLATVDGVPAGCVALRQSTGSMAEIKRMFVRPAFRRQNIGEALVASVIGEANTLGYKTIELSSFHLMTSAHAIYRRAGFVDVPSPPGFPEAMKGLVVFMEKNLETIES
jgi:putative acetyltransferase